MAPRIDHQITFGQWLKLRRKALDLTQDALAARVGCANHTLQKIEQGIRTPSRDLAERLAAQLELSVEEQTHFVRLARTGARTAVDILAPPARAVSDARQQRLMPPEPPTALIGRAAERHALVEQLRARDRRLLTVVGPGGIGKTLLAHHVATLAASDDLGFPDGAAIVWLASVAAAHDVPLAITTALGIQVGGSRPGTDQVVAALRDRALLLVLDGIEHFLAQPHGDAVTTLIARILDEAPGVRVLVTSRERLRLRGESLLKLDGLGLPPVDAGPRLDGADAVRLFVDRAQHVSPDFALHAENRAAVARICRLLEGMPLAVELAAAWTGVLSPAEIVLEIDRALDFLAQHDRDTTLRHRSMRAALDHSWNLLTGDERRALARLSVFRGSYERDAAAAVSGAALPTIMALIDKSLLRRTGNRDTTRYTMHELVRQYAAERLAAEPEDRTATEARHTAHYVALLQRATEPHTAHATPNAVVDLTPDLDNVRAAWTRAVAGGDTAALAAMARGVWMLYNDRGWLHDGAALFGTAAAALRAAGADALRGALLGLHGYFLVRAGRIAASRAALEEGLALLQRESTTDALRTITYNLGIVDMRQGRLAEAHAYFTQTVVLARSAGDELLALLTELYLSTVAKFQGDWPAAETRLTAFLDQCRQQRYGRMESHCLVHLAELAWYGERYGEATVHLQAALRIAGESDDRWVISMCLGFLGGIALVREQVHQARYLLSEALAGLREVGDAFGIARTLSGLTHVALAMDDAAAARLACAEMVRIAADGEALILPDAAFGLAALLEREGHDAEALGLLLAIEDLPGDGKILRRASSLRADLQRRLSASQQTSAAALSRRSLVPWLHEIAGRPVAARAEAALPDRPRVAAGGNDLGDTGATLSPREVEVLRLLMAGASNAAIAETLVISRYTAKNHVASILRKLEVATRTEAALRGHALGLQPLAPR